MGGVTASGYPYVTPTDHPKEFPAHSQALANRLEGGDAGTTYTPTLTNCTAQTIAAEYWKHGRLVTVAVKLTVATMGTGPLIGLPFPADVLTNAAGVGIARMAVGGLYWAMVGTSSAAFTLQVTTTNGLAVGITPTIPNTWAAGHIVSFVATYKSTS